MNRPLVSRRFPYLRIYLLIHHRTSMAMTNMEKEALIDTGFDGDVVLPSSHIFNGEPPDGYLTWKLADGSEVLAPAYVGELMVSSSLGPFDVVITVLGDEPLVGRNLISHFTVILDHGAKVVVEP